MGPAKKGHSFSGVGALADWGLTETWGPWTRTRRARWITVPLKCHDANITNIAETKMKLFYVEV